MIFEAIFKNCYVNGLKQTKQYGNIVLHNEWSKYKKV